MKNYFKTLNQRFPANNASRLRSLLFAVLIATVGTIVLINSKAASYCDIAPASTKAAIEAAVAGCADGTIVRFPLNASYTLADRLSINNRNNLVIDGNGSTFKLTAPNDGLALKPNWMIVRGQNVHIKNMKVVGNFYPKPLSYYKAQHPDWSDERIGMEYHGQGEVGNGKDINGQYNTVQNAGNGNQFNPGIAIYGGRDNSVTDMSIDNVFGDGVLVATAYYTDAAIHPLNSPYNTLIQRVKATTTARMCFAPTQAEIIKILDSECAESYYGGIDAEIDTEGQVVHDLTIERNKFKNYHQFAVAVPVAGINYTVHDIVIRDNIFETPPYVYCQWTVLLGYWNNDDIKNPDGSPEDWRAKGRYFKNILVENNTFLQHRGGTGVSFAYVQNGTIKNNKSQNPGTNICGLPFFENRRDNINTITENNPPNTAATYLPGGTSSPPQPDPTIPPPDNGTLTAPANLTGTRVSDNRIDLDWDPSSGPVIAYYIWRDNAYLGAVHVNEAKTFYSDTSVNGTSTYTYFVRAGDTADNTKGSNTVTVGPFTSNPQPPPPTTACTNKPISDLNCDGSVNAIDISTFRSRYKAKAVNADINKDGNINPIDISTFRQRYKTGT